MSLAASTQRWLSISLLALAFAALLAACGKSDDAAETRPATPAEPKLAAGEFGIARIEADSYGGQPAALVTFSKPLATAQKFDALIAVAGDDGKAPSGSWMLDEGDTRRLRFPYLAADQTFRLTFKPTLAAADGATLGKAVERELYTGPLEPLAGFASQGSVLPAHDTRGLPVVTVNVPELDVEFLRVKDADLAKFLASYTANGRRSYWSLDELSKFTTSVYRNRFALDGAANQRTLSYLPIRDIGELEQPGLYFAVMTRPNNFAYESDTAMFFVSDLGIHVRAYPGRLLVHAASLETGKPLAGVELEVRDKNGATVKQADTDGDGLASLDGYKLDATEVLVATRDRDVSLIPFNQPALDLSEFAIAGRAQRDVEVFPWSGRDLYRPGETLRVSALLRDFDGRPLPPQPLYATLKQPDGRALLTQAVESKELGYYVFERRIADDAATGRWTLEFSTDPAQTAGVHAFNFRVEEFLPERLKLELSSTKERLAPGEALPLEVDADYLYGAPAAGNRFTARVALANDAHPIDALKDFWFGDALVELPKEPRDAIDQALDANGELEQDVAPFESGEAPKSPVAVIVSGSVFETGGRAVSRSMKRSIWPADELVGVRPLFDAADGAAPNADAAFEIVRANAAGELLAAGELAVKLVREVREYHWRYENGIGWRTDFVERLETVEEQKLAFAAGQRGRVAFAVQWGGYRLEVTDPATGLTSRYAFEAGWSLDDENRGTAARPDKVKLALDKTHYRGGDTLKVTVTPPHEGPALLMLESDELLWHETLNVRPGTEVEIALKPEWERHDLYLTALVFRPGSVPQKVTPNRAVGIAHVAMARDDRSVPVTVTSPEVMRPKQPIKVSIAAPALAGKTARVKLTAVDLGVLNITRFALPDATSWFFAQRRLSIDAYDLYGRVVEAYEGERARQRYGGDAALAALPSARRPNAGIETVDLFHEPVALDAQGNATVEIAVPDFNGTLRVRALVFGEDRYGAAEHDTIVRAPLVVEASTPRVLAPGDRSKVTLDLQNLSGKAGEFAVEVTATGPVTLARNREKVALDDQEKRTLAIGLEATGAYGVGEIRARVSGPDVDLDRRFRFVVRPAWPAETRTSTTVLETAQAVTPDGALLAGLIPESVLGRITVGTLPPLPFGAAVEGLFEYPYGCIEQTSSRAFPLVWLDDATADRFGVSPIPAETRAKMLSDAFTRISSMQADTGHFSMWPGDGWVNTQMTPYVAELLLNARDAGFAIPDAVLKKALDRINEDLLSGGNGHYEYDHAEHLRIAEMAYGGYALARVAKAPIGTLRALYDNEREKLEAPLPLVHLAIAFKLMGDQARADAAIEEAFTRKFERPDYLGDYGTALRDATLMLALAHEHGLSKPAYDAQIVDLAREMYGEGGADGVPQYLSTQEKTAIFRLGRAILGEKGRTFGASISVAGAVEERTGQQLVARSFGTDELRAGVRITPNGAGPLYVVQDFSGIPRDAPAASTDKSELRIRREWYLPDGTPFKGERIREGDVLIAHVAVDSNETMNDALVVDLLPGGLEVENLNLTDASQWENVTIAGVTLSERSNGAEIRHEEYRDDRYVAALKIWGGSTSNLFYLVRAVSPGEFVVPPAGIEDMYRPTLRAFSASRPARVSVVAPSTAIEPAAEAAAETARE